jgi:hypothetical protein
MVFESRRMSWEKLKCIQNFGCKSPKENYNLHELAVYGKITLKSILKSCVNVWTQLKSGQGILESSYENWDVFFSSIIARNFLKH